MFKYLLIILLTVPLLELYVLIRVGSVLGGIATIALCLFTAFLGAVLLRQQGIQTLHRLQTRLDHGEMPASDVIEGMLLMVSGIMLLTPGFITDITGFLLLLPALRANLATGLLIKLLRQYSQRRTGNTIIIEGEFRD